MNIIEASNIVYKNKNKMLFHNINLEIEEGSFVTVIGENS